MFYRSGETVRPGTYWGTSTGERFDFEMNTMLPVDNSHYVKANTYLMLLAAPLIGLLFAVFLPFIGIFMSGKLLAEKVYSALKDLAAASISFGWRPLEAYLNGKNKRINKKQLEKKE